VSRSTPSSDVYVVGVGRGIDTTPVRTVSSSVSPRVHRIEPPRRCTEISARNFG